MQRIELKIEGMTCGHCADRVERALAAVAGVSDVTVELASGSAVVEGAGFEESSLVAAVDGAGYAAVIV